MGHNEEEGERNATRVRVCDVKNEGEDLYIGGQWGEEGRV